MGSAVAAGTVLVGLLALSWAVRQALGSSAAPGQLSLATYSVAGVWLLVANVRAGAYLAGTGAAGLRHVLAHLPVSRHTKAALPWTLGSLRTALMALLLGAVAAGAWPGGWSLALGVVAALLLPTLPVAVGWRLTSRDDDFAAWWVLAPMALLFTASMLPDWAPNGVFADLVAMLGMPAAILLGIAPVGPAAGFLLSWVVVAALIAATGNAAAPSGLDTIERRSNRWLALPARPGRAKDITRVCTQIAASRSTSLRLVLCLATGSVAGAALAVQLPTISDSTAFVPVLGVASAVAVSVAVVLPHGVLPAGFVARFAHLPVRSASLHLANARVIGALGAVAVGLAAITCLVTTALVGYPAGRVAALAFVGALATPWLLALTVETIAVRSRGIVRWLATSLVPGLICTRLLVGMVLALVHPYAVVLPLALDLAAGRLVRRLLATGTSDRTPSIPSEETP
ncbi:MAG: hypothetical protein CSA84_03580 [Actinomycetales bacterium]|nr:MAG: hypothetical protein CSA84_03580 [Actinomycetales bacterium]